MQDAWRAYLEVALGLTEASRKKAREVTKNLFDRGEATAAQLQNAASELLATSRANRETLARLVRYEVDRALGALGLATSEEVTELTERVRELERAVHATGGVAVPGAPAARPVTAQAAPAKAARKTPAKKTPGKKATVKKAAAKKATAKQATTKQAPQPAKKTVAKKTVAKKAAAKKGTGTAGAAPGTAGAA